MDHVQADVISKLGIMFGQNIVGVPVLFSSVQNVNNYILFLPYKCLKNNPS